MLTIFTNPRPFVGPFDTLQRNAIRSWLALRAVCDVEIILFNDEDGTSKVIAEEYGIHCVTDVACNQNGTPLLSDVFAQVHRIASQPVLAQVNSDIILMSDFVKAIMRIREQLGENEFFMIGRRWDFDVTQVIDYAVSDWEEQLRKEVCERGSLHGLAGIDYWVFPRSFHFNPPQFAVGRPGMDSWLVYKARSQGVPVIDASNAVMIVHQNHNYPAKKTSYYETEKETNIKLAGGFKNMMTLRDADWVYTESGLRRPVVISRIVSALSTFYPWRLLLAVKRMLQARCG